MSHTPGPWNFDPDKVAPWDENWVSSKYGILARVLGDQDDPEDNANGNAYLIAAVPDLLEACEMMVKAFVFKTGSKEEAMAYYSMLEAISKATGGLKCPLKP